MTKKITAMILSLTLCLSLTGCIQIVKPGTSTKPSPMQASLAPSPVYTTTAPSIVPTSEPTSTQTSTSSNNVLGYFEKIVFASGSGDAKWDNMIKRWESPIRVEVLGEPTEADMDMLNTHMINLSAIVPKLDMAFLEGSGDESGSLTISFVPMDKMADTIKGYKEGDWGSMYIYWDENGRITKAQIAIATDATTQKARNHLIIMEVTQCLGFLGSSMDHEDSVFYTGWKETQTLSALDQELVTMLYSDSVYAGQPKEEALAALKSYLDILEGE